MKLEDQVVSLDLAKRLKELGVKQKSHFIWANGGYKWFVSPDHEIIRINDPGYAQPWPSAFTVAEMGEMLPPGIASFQERMANTQAEIKKWFCAYEEEADDHGPVINPRVENADTEADARAKMLIYLIEKGMVKP